MLKVDKIEIVKDDSTVYTINKDQLQDFPLIGGTQANSVTTKVWNQNGESFVENFMDTQDGELIFILRTMYKTDLEIYQMRKEVIDICNPLIGKLQMKVFLNTGDIFYREITFRSAPLFPIGFENRNMGWQKVQLSYTAHNPFWYSDNEITESFQSTIPQFYFPFTTEGEKSEVYSDFVGKIVGSTVENPNLFRYRQAATVATAITDFVSEASQSHITGISAVGGTNSTYGTTTSGNIPQMMWSFNILQILERRFGVAVWQGVTTLSEKVARAKNLVSYIKYSYYGYATNATGNSITLQTWRSDTNVFYGPATFTNNAITQHTITNSVPKNNIDANGFVHIMAYTTASNGTVASNLINDYININLTTTLDYKPDAIIFGTILPNKVATNTGQVPAPVTIIIEGACTNPQITKIINGEEKAYLKFNNLTMGANDKLEIHTAFGEKGVWLNGKSIFNKLDFTSDFFSLDVGENEIDFSDDTGNTTAKIHFIYRNLYLSI